MTVAMILSAGRSRRIGQAGNKNFISLHGHPILSITLSKFEDSPFIDEILVILQKKDFDRFKKEILEGYKFKKIKDLIEGGEERQDSVYNGMLFLEQREEKPDLILIHDGARPFLSLDLIKESVVMASKYGAVITGIPLSDTVKLINSEGEITKTLDREKIWLAQTPQAFRYDLILESYQRAVGEKYYATDDAALVERLGIKVKAIKGEETNIKITTPFDLIVGKLILKEMGVTL